MVGCQCRLFLYCAGADCDKTYCTVVDADDGCQCRLPVYRAGAECRPTLQWWIQMVGCQCSLFLYRAGAECNKTYCLVVDTDGGVPVSSVPL